MTAPCPGCHTPEAESAPQEAVERITDAEAAEWARLVSEATNGPWVVDPDGSIGAPMAGFCGLWVVNANVSLIETDAAFIAAARTAVPRLLDEREALRAEVERMRAYAGPGPYEPSEADGAKAPTWQELRALADHNFGLYAEATERLTGERDEARVTIARLNARAQVAEAALHELTTTTGRGKAHRVAREVWQRCEESHGLVCPTTGRARDLAARLEDELARLREGVAMLADELHSHGEAISGSEDRWYRGNGCAERDAAGRMRALLADTDAPCRPIEGAE